VYLELIDARQASLVLLEAVSGCEQRRGAGAVRQRPAPLLPRLTAAELEAHRTFIASLGEQAVWNRYLAEGAVAQTA
jgi:DNA polymerase-3 subunit epsilon